MCHFAAFLTVSQASDSEGLGMRRGEKEEVEEESRKHLFKTIEILKIETTLENADMLLAH